MSIETAIRGRLLAYPGVASLVGTRIFPQLMPQGTTLPAITYAVVSRTTEPTMGYSNTGMWSTLLQIDVWADSYSGVKVLADQVRAALMDWYQESTEPIWRVLHRNEEESYESDTLTFRVSLDFEVLSAVGS